MSRYPKKLYQIVNKVNNTSSKYLESLSAVEQELNNLVVKNINIIGDPVTYINSTYKVIEFNCDESNDMESKISDIISDSNIVFIREKVYDHILGHLNENNQNDYLVRYKHIKHEMSNSLKEYLIKERPDILDWKYFIISEFSIQQLQEDVKIADKIKEVFENKDVSCNMIFALPSNNVLLHVTIREDGDLAMFNLLFANQIKYITIDLQSFIDKMFKSMKYSKENSKGYKSQSSAQALDIIRGRFLKEKDNE